MEFLAFTTPKNTLNGNSTFSLSWFYTVRMASNSYSWQKPYLSPATVSLLPFSGQKPPDFINALIRKWGLEFLFTNKQISLCIWVAPPLLPLSSAAAEARRKFSMKQRRHAAQWLTSGAQGHWCWLEKANTIFYESNRFRSKFGEAKHPDRSEYSPFIRKNNAASIFGKIVWTWAFFCLSWSGVNLLTWTFWEHMHELSLILRQSEFTFVVISAAGFLVLMYSLLPVAVFLLRSESFCKQACLSHWTGAVTELLTVLSLCKNITGLTKKLICQSISCDTWWTLF